MATPDYILALREHIGHAQLFLPGATAIIVRDVPAGASIFEVPTVLLARRADTGAWAPICGICEPGEEPSHTAVREVREEVGLEARVEALLGVGQMGPVEYPNGDQCIFMDTALRCSVPADATPTLGDSENTEVAWFSVAQLPQSVGAAHRLMIADAVAQLKHPAGFQPRVGFAKRRR
ncbi:NUDIX domain-containing protein [Corynebacterium lizhenjunii]|uniref:NUDIX domain-containing protein n=1 Tax=Corynebacterium lizhenjunii TaxID=2709394 RepID=A0A7T0KD35_9CORY|nr:NUDIX domain-containing protein [Corynebacterium lizhenjunii]QPK78548.1 NUDIX domain-containing protein [Corynebacterium lizhenjunii]